MNSSNQGTDQIQKTFVFQDKDTQQSSIIDHCIDNKAEMLDLNPILNQHCPSAKCQVSIYDPDSARFKNICSFGQESGIVPRGILEPNIILVRFAQKILIDGTQGIIDHKTGLELNNQAQEGRSKERTIGEVLEVVKKWRYLHYNGHISLKQRPNLQEAAKMMGISKKSLDDYYCQLRLGQSYNFDFIHNLDEKIGVLRNFVKDHRPEKIQSIRKLNDKHPKKLRIIETYDIKNHKFKDKVNEEEDKEIMNIFQPILIQPPELMQKGDMLSEKGSIFGCQSADVADASPQDEKLYDFQHNFFKDFDMAFGEEGDPYFEVNKQYWQRDLQVDSDSFMLME